MPPVSIHTGSRELAEIVLAPPSSDTIVIRIPDRKAQMAEALSDPRTAISSPLFGVEEKNVLMVGGGKFDAAAQKQFIAELEKRDGVNVALFVEKPSPTTKKYGNKHGGVTTHALPSGERETVDYVYDALTSNEIVVSKDTVSKAVSSSRGDNDALLAGLLSCVEIWGGTGEAPDEDMVVEKMRSKEGDIADEVISSVLSGDPAAVSKSMSGADFEPMKLHGYVSGVIFRILADLSGGQTYPSTFKDNSEYMIQRARSWARKSSNRYTAYTLSEAASLMSDAYSALVGGPGRFINDEKTLEVYFTRAANAIRNGARG